VTGNDEPSDRPDWWRENERIREERGLPPYDPPRFADGTYVHEVLDRLETDRGVDLRLMGVNTRYPEDWEVRVDGEPAFDIERTRDENGNTVYGLDADAFVRRVDEHLRE
jgi:hypothetical protein